MPSPRRPADPRAAGPGGMRQPSGPGSLPAKTATGAARSGSSSGTGHRTGGAAGTAGARPSSSRPGTRPRGRGPATPARGTAAVEHVRPGVPRMFSVRAIVLGLVVVMAFVLVYPTLNSYIREQAALADLRAQVEAAKTRNDDLAADVKRWDDPAYVKAQARERLSFVLPGETPYRVVDPEAAPDAPVAADGPKSVLDDSSTKPWYATVLDSVAIAGDLPVDAGTGTAAAGDEKSTGTSSTDKTDDSKSTDTSTPTDG